jgi:hypothetical protein
MVCGWCNWLCPKTAHKPATSLTFWATRRLYGQIAILPIKSRPVNVIREMGWCKSSALQHGGWPFAPSLDFLGKRLFCPKIPFDTQLAD